MDILSRMSLITASEIMDYLDRKKEEAEGRAQDSLEPCAKEAYRAYADHLEKLRSDAFDVLMAIAKEARSEVPSTSRNNLE